MKARATAMDWTGKHSEIDKAIVGICERHPIKCKLPKWIERPGIDFTLSSFFCFSNGKLLEACMPVFKDLGVESRGNQFFCFEILYLTPLVLDQSSFVPS